MTENIEVTQLFEHLSVLNVAPDDVIIVRTPRRITAGAAELIQEQVKLVWPDNRCLVLSEGLEIAVGHLVDVGEQERIKAFDEEFVPACDTEGA